MIGGQHQLSLPFAKRREGKGESGDGPVTLCAPLAVGAHPLQVFSQQAVEDLRELISLVAAAVLRRLPGVQVYVGELNFCLFEILLDCNDVAVDLGLGPMLGCLGVLPVNGASRGFDLFDAVTVAGGDEAVDATADLHLEFAVALHVGYRHFGQVPVGAHLLHLLVCSRTFSAATRVDETTGQVTGLQGKSYKAAHGDLDRYSSHESRPIK